MTEPDEVACRNAALEEAALLIDAWVDAVRPKSRGLAEAYEHAARMVRVLQRRPDGAK